MPGRGPRRRAALVLLVPLLALVGCRAETEIAIEVAENGSGTVTVAIGLDAEAMTRLGDPATAVRTGDLTRAGWTVTGPTSSRSLTWFRATTAFRSPADLPRVLRQIGILRGWSVRVSDGFGSTTWAVSGRIHLTGSLDQFSDHDLTTLLDGLPIGRTREELRAEIGSEARPFPLRIRVDLPADPEGRSAWSFEVGDGTAVDRTLSVAASHRSATPTALLLIGAIAAVLAVASVLIGRTRRRDS